MVRRLTESLLAQNALNNPAAPAAAAGVSKPAMDYPATMLNYWPMDEGSGTSIEDTVGGIDGTLQGSGGTPSWETNEGMGGSVVEFDKAEEMDLPINNLQYTSDFTVCVLARHDEAAASGKYVEFLENFVYLGGGNQRGWAFNWDYSTAGLRAYFGYGGSRIDLYVTHATAGISEGELHLFSAAFNFGSGGSIKIFVDDTEVGSTSHTSTVIYNTGYNVPYMGGPSNSSRGLKGQVGWAAIYDGALAEADIANLYNSLGVS